MSQEVKFKLCPSLTVPKRSLAFGSYNPNHNSPEAFEILCSQIVDHLELPKAFTWSMDEVSFWIKSLGFPQYENTFRVNFINGRKLLLIDASTLVKMNIKDFDHIKTIAKAIREVFDVELEKFDRSISLLPRHPETLFKFHKVPTGPMHDSCLRSKFFKKLKVMKEPAVILNHFERLHEWLKHIPQFQNIRVGGIKRANLHFVEPNPHRELEKVLETSTCQCTLPPCECNWSEKEKRKPWRLTFLVEVEDGKYDEGVCRVLQGEVQPN